MYERQLALAHVSNIPTSRSLSVPLVRVGRYACLAILEFVSCATVQAYFVTVHPTITEQTGRGLGGYKHKEALLGKTDQADRLE